MSDQENERSVLDWSEKLALENMRDHYNALDGIKEQGKNLLALVTAGGGAAFAYAIRELSKDSHFSPLVISALVLTATLCFVGAGINLKILRLREMPSVTNTPRATYQPQFSLDVLRKTELDNLQARIDQAVKINGQAAQSLSRLQLSMLLTPIVFMAAYGIATVCRY